MIRDIHTALVTPMREGSLDSRALGRLVLRQIEAGVQGLVLGATTGEGAALDEDERRSVIETAIEINGKQFHINVRMECTSTRATVAATAAL